MYYSSTAPGDYCPEKVNLNKGPEYSLSGKGSSEKPIDNPGQYNQFSLYFVFTYFAILLLNYIIIFN